MVDVSNAEEVNESCKQILQDLGRVDILVNGALVATGELLEGEFAAGVALLRRAAAGLSTMNPIRLYLGEGLRLGVRV